MAIGSRLNSEIQALRQATVNAGQASSMLQIADGAMASTSDILTRMKTLTVQASSDQLGNTERGMLDTEYQTRLSEIDRIAMDTKFNGKSRDNGTNQRGEKDQKRVVVGKMVTEGVELGGGRSI